MAVGERSRELGVVFTDYFGGATEFGSQFDYLFLSLMHFVNLEGQDAHQKYAGDDYYEVKHLSLIENPALSLIGILLANVNGPILSLSLRGLTQKIDPDGAAPTHALGRVVACLHVFEVLLIYLSFLR